MCVLQEIKSVCAFCSLSCELLFVGDKFTADHFEDDIIPLIKSNYMLNFSQDVTMNHVRDKGKPPCKLSYRLFSNNLEMIHFLKYLHFQHGFS